MKQDFEWGVWFFIGSEFLAGFYNFILQKKQVWLSKRKEKLEIKKHGREKPENKWEELRDSIFLKHKKFDASGKYYVIVK